MQIIIDSLQMILLFNDESLTFLQKQRLLIKLSICLTFPSLERESA